MSVLWFIKNWVQDWVQVATLETGSRLVSCAGSTKGLTATNQEVAGSSPAGRAKSRTYSCRFSLSEQL